MASAHGLKHMRLGQIDVLIAADLDGVTGGAGDEVAFEGKNQLSGGVMVLRDQVEQAVGAYNPDRGWDMRDKGTGVRCGSLSWHIQGGKFASRMPRCK